MGTLKQPTKPLIAVVDDDESIRDTTKDLLDSASFRTATFASAEAFVKSPRLSCVSVMITDMRMPGMSGLELHHHLVASGNPIPTILATAYPDEAVRARALRVGVVCYLAKPFVAEELLACIDTAIKAGKQRGNLGPASD